MEDLAIASERRLRAAGKRITPQRKLVLGILARADSHLDACAIYERGLRHDAGLSLSTVYRTLNILKQAGVVRELHLDDEHHHYELDGKEEHCHLICLACAQVLEVDSATLTQAVAAAGQTHDFEIVQVELAGYCADCRQQ